MYFASLSMANIYVRVSCAPGYGSENFLATGVLCEKRKKNGTLGDVRGCPQEPVILRRVMWVVGALAQSVILFLIHGHVDWECNMFARNLRPTQGHSRYIGSCRELRGRRF